MSVEIYLEIERGFLVNHNGFMATERPNINKQFVVQGFWGKDQQICIFDNLLNATHIEGSKGADDPQ